MSTPSIIFRDKRKYSGKQSTMDSNELNRALASRFEEVCQLLLPNGKRKGSHWLVGGINGEAGESLQITLDGSAAGRFVDFAHPETKGASPLWLWKQARGIKFTEAIKQAQEFLGVHETDYGIKRHKPKTYAKPGPAGIRPVDSNTKVMDYLVVERKLDPLVIAKAKVCETDDGEAIAFPFIETNEDGQQVCVHRKYLNIERIDGKKDSWTTKGTKRPLYGKNLIDDDVTELVITEGEIDALTYNSWAIPAVSIPNGVNDMEWLDVDWDWLARFEKIYISTDMDEPGRVLAPELCQRLGLHRCYIVELPHKDANECMMAGMKREDMERVLKSAKAIELDEIKRPDDFKAEVMDYYETDPSSRGIETPWTPTLPWRIRKGEFTIMTGFSGHGKTAGLNQLMLHLVSKGLKVMDASLEIRPGMTLYNMTRCALGKKNSNKDEVHACIEWLNESVFFLDCIGTVNVSRIMHAMEYARKRHGIDVFVIDSLFKCGLSSEDYGGARDFADKLTTFCNNTGAHVILVAHSRKVSSGNENAVPSKSDVAGSSDLTNAAFNVVIFWRNKRKKKEIDDAYLKKDTEKMAMWMDEPDGKIVLDKQRFGEGEEREVAVWFTPGSCQFHTTKATNRPYFALEVKKVA